MYRTTFSFAILVSLVVVAGCKKSEPTELVSPSSSVGFLYYGAVVPNPVSTMITVEQEEIRSVSTQKGVVLSSWSAKIQMADYDHLVSIIDNNNLIGAPDPIGGRPCVGSGGMSIFVNQHNTVDTINILGIYMCDRSCWPTGLDSLVVFQDSLVNKYKS